MRRSTDRQENDLVLGSDQAVATLSAGALLGGVVVDTTSVSTAMVCGGLVAALTAVVLGSTRRRG